MAVPSISGLDFDRLYVEPRLHRQEEPGSPPMCPEDFIKSCELICSTRVFTLHAVGVAVLLLARGGLGGLTSSLLPSGWACPSTANTTLRYACAFGFFSTGGQIQVCCTAPGDCFLWAKICRIISLCVAVMPWLQFFLPFYTSMKFFWCHIHSRRCIWKGEGAKGVLNPEGS